MSALQSFVTSLVPRSWAISIETESRQWKMQCSCGHEKSIWELGGIRWKGAGNPRRYGHCSQCGQSSWMKFYRDQSAS